MMSWWFPPLEASHRCCERSMWSLENPPQPRWEMGIITPPFLAVDFNWTYGFPGYNFCFDAVLSCMSACWILCLRCPIWHKAAFAEPSMAEKAVKASWLDRSGWVDKSKCNSLQRRVEAGKPHYHRIMEAAVVQALNKMNCCFWFIYIYWDHGINDEDHQSLDPQLAANTILVEFKLLVSLWISSFSIYDLSNQQQG